MERLVSIKDFEEVAKKRLAKPAYDYYSSGANGMVSLKEGIEIYGKLKLRPSLFSDPRKFKGMDTKVFGEIVGSPIFAASTAFQRMAHPDGEAATARAC